MDKIKCQYLKEHIKQLQSFDQPEWKDICLTLFAYQYADNPVYRRYCDLLNRCPTDIIEIDDIPLLPIESFKYHKVVTGVTDAYQLYFESSGTMYGQRSKHYYADLRWYQDVSRAIWKKFIRSDGIKPIVIALLPGYLERGHSSLVSMMDHIIHVEGCEGSGFYLHQYDQVSHIIQKAKVTKTPVVLLGVTYALLDLAQYIVGPNPHLVLIETGGMKGTRPEMSKEELHDMLKKAYGLDVVYSEYGMTELFSQAYAMDDTRFSPAPTLYPMVKELNDPLSNEKFGKTGIMGFIDLANVDTCAFILTQDLGIVYKDLRFSISGRLHNADIRGCNLMLEDVAE